MALLTLFLATAGAVNNLVALTAFISTMAHCYQSFSLVFSQWKKKKRFDPHLLLDPVIDLLDTLVGMVAKRQ